VEWDVRYAPQSVAVGNIVFVSGCTGERAGEHVPARVEGQVELALDNARRALEAVGSGLENVVKTFFLLTSLDDYGSVRRTETEHYERHAPQLVTTPPAATLMVVPSLARPEYLVQYEVVAALDRDRPGGGVTYHPEYWAGRELAYPHVPKEHPKFARSQSIGDLLIVSGCQALDHETLRVEAADFAGQCRVVLDKVRIAVEETGGSLADLVKTNVFVKDAGAVAAYRDIEQAYFLEHAPEVATDPPASTVFVVAELPRPEFLVEVEAFAAGKAVPLVFVPACHGSELSEALDSLGGALERAGSAVGRVVKLTVLLRDAEDYPHVRSALDGWFETRPATTFIEVAATVPAGARFQLDAVAVC